MKSLISSLIGFVLSVSVSAASLIEGRVRLDSGELVADAQVRLFDMSDLRQGAIARATTDGTGYFALPLASLGGHALPQGFALGPNYPNPFNPSTIIPYQLAALSEVRLEVFNLLGQRLATLVDGERPAGFHTATWTATDAAGRAVGAGVYIYRMTVGAASQTGRMVLIDGQAGVSAAGAASVGLGASDGRFHGEDAQVYGLIVSGSGFAPYMDSAFRVESGMAPVELVVSAGQHSAGKATDDDCALCDLFDAFDNVEEEDAENTPDDEGVGPSGKAQATLEAPPAPLNLRVEAITDTSARVRWDAVEGATDYDVNYKKAEGGKWTNVPHKGTKLYNTLTGLDPGTEYRWAVRAENKDGASNWVFGENFRTLGAPDPPTNLRITDLTETSARLHWDAVEGATDYDVNYKKAAGGKWTNVPHKGTELYSALTGLEPGTQYRWAVRAENDMGPSAWVYADNFTTLGKGPDLIVQSPSASAVVLTPGQAFTLHVTVHNQGDEQAAAATLHYYRSNNTTISASDTEVGTGAVDALDASATSAESIELTASVGVEKYYGACVASVDGESNTDNNCSSAVKITVSGPETEEEEEEETPEEGPDTPEDVPDDAPVTIPDAKLRAAIAKALGKASGATITKDDMETLTTLSAEEAGLRDLTGLEFATNLIRLDLAGNTISDISPLSGLTNLRGLFLAGNTISDISPLSGLTNLGGLFLAGNTISDISPLSGLTNLTQLFLVGNVISDISALRGLTNLRGLFLDGNTISDISPLSGLTNLTQLFLVGNAISDISALRGLTNLNRLFLDSNIISDISPLSGLTNLYGLYLSGNIISDISPLSGLTNLIWLDLKGQPLSASSINDHIPALQRSGATVSFDPPLRESDFDIELVFLDDHFDERHKRVIQYAARRWMSIIREDLPDYTFTGGWSEPCGDRSYAIPSGERIDDLRIYVVSFKDASDDAFGGWASSDVLRETSHLSVVGCMGFNLVYSVSLSTALHEIGHVLGIGTRPWDNNGFVQKSLGDVHFNGPLAIAAFNDAGGRNYTGKKVPLEEDWAHWRQSVLSGELMEPGSGQGVVSAITIQALADIGYSVDVTQADPYTLPHAAAKVVAAGSTPDDHLPGRLVPQRACGVGTERKPIHVVDPQGRIVRTLHR